MSDAAAPARVSPSIALLTFARAVERRLEPELRVRGLTMRKYALLGHIARTPDVSYSELARRSGITVQSAHALIQTLIAEGWVETADGTSVGVAARLTASDRGERLLDDVATVVERLDQDLFSRPPLAGLEGALRAAVAGASSRP